MKLYKKSTEKVHSKAQQMPRYDGAVGQPSGTNDCPFCKMKKKLTNYT